MRIIYLDRCKRLVEQDRGQSVCIVHSKMKIDVSHVQGMDDTRNITQYCQENVDEEVGIATALEENTKRREEDGEDDLADVAIVRAKLVLKFTKSSTETQVGARRIDGGDRGIHVLIVADGRTRVLPCSEWHGD